MYAERGTWKAYVGRTTQPQLRQAAHRRKPPKRLQQALDRDGTTTADFYFVILETCSTADGHDREAFWTRALDTQWPHGYNAFEVCGDPLKNRRFRGYMKKRHHRTF